jgi:hypothetical protein
LSFAINRSKNIKITNDSIGLVLFAGHLNQQKIDPDESMD